MKGENLMNKEIINILVDLTIEIENRGRLYSDIYLGLDEHQNKTRVFEFADTIKDEKEIVCLISNEIELCTNKIRKKIINLYGKEGFLYYIEEIIKKRKCV